MLDGKPSLLHVVREDTGAFGDAALAVSDLLTSTTDPEQTLDGLLEKIAETAVVVARADLGGVAAWLDSTRSEARCGYRAIGGAGRSEPVRSLGAWAKCMFDDVGGTLAGRRPNGPSASLDDDLDQCFFEGARSIVSSAIAIEHGVLRIQVEASRAAAFEKGAREALKELATHGEILLRRSLLRAHAATQGMDLSFLGFSPAFLEFEDQVRMIGQGAESSVLITGERGAGKELAAFAIHYYSRRRHRPFVALNSAALTDTLFSDELFGHERGAYTGAHALRRGALSAADGGTLFLDEIGDMAPSIQASLLRFLETGELRRIGSDQSRFVDVRVVAATNRDLGELVRDGSFRADILDRLNVFHVRVPTLRERSQDIELLASYFLKKACADSGRKERVANPKLCSSCEQQAGAAAVCACPSLYRALVDHPFPGNVRELRNIMLRAASLVQDQEIEAQHVRPHLSPLTAHPVDDDDVDPSLDATIRRHIEKILEQESFNKSAAARVLGIPLTTLVNKMKRLGMT